MLYIQFMRELNPVLEMMELTITYDSRYQMEVAELKPSSLNSKKYTFQI